MPAPVFDMYVPKPGETMEQRMKGLTNSYIDLTQMLQVLLSGHLDSKNVSSITTDKLKAGVALIGTALIDALVVGTNVDIGSAPKVFHDEPTTPYRVKDIWIDGTDLKRCIVARASGAFVAADWDLGTNYTNPTGVTTIVDGVVTTDFVNALGVIANSVIAEWVYAGAITTDQITAGAATIGTALIDALVVGTNVAQGTAPKVYYTEPTTPYRVNDVWINGTDLKRCATARASGAFVAGDWTLGTNYTNPTGVTSIVGGVVTTDFVNALSVIANSVVAEWIYAGNITADQLTIGGGGEQISDDLLENTVALAAAQAAEDAQDDATDALGELDDIASDAKITPVEKLEAKQRWDAIVVEGTPTTGTIPLQATAFGVSDTDFDTDYSALNVYLNTTLTVFANMTTTTNITRATWDTAWKNYYDERTKLLNAIAAKAKEIADAKRKTFTPALVTPPVLTFTRASVAVKLDGTEVASGEVRYETGEFGNSLMIEEGTTNLLTATQSDVEADTTGLAANIAGVTISRDTGEHWQGAASLKTITPGNAALEGFRTTSASVSASLAYTASVWVKGSGTVVLGLGERDASDVAIGGIVYGSVVTLSSTWQRTTVSKTFGATGVKARLYVITDVTQAITFYADGLLLEQKAYDTSWIEGGVTRVAETLSVPTAGVFTKGSTTVEFWFEPTSTPLKTSGVLCVVFINSTNYYVIYAHSTGRVYVQTRSGADTVNDYNSSDPVLAVGTKYHIAAKWDGTTMCHFVNGVKGLDGDTAYTEPVGSLPANMYLGSNYSSTSHPDGIYDDLRISNIARTDAEILADYNSGAALPMDNYTTAKLNFDDDILAEDFVPYPPYKPGDLWAGGSAADLKRCIIQRLTGAYDAADWELATKYTDDVAADAAQSAADDAQADATTALGELDDIASDAKITPVEKLEAKQRWDAIVVEGTATTGTIPAQAIALGVSHTDFDTDYAALDVYLNTTLTVFANMATTTNITRTDWDTAWKNYYDERTKILNAIAATMVQLSTQYNKTQITAANGIQVLDATDTERVKMGQIGAEYGVQATHSDGSYSKMTESGFYRSAGGTNYDYMFRIYVDDGSTTGGGYNTSTNAVTVTLPADFQNKDFKVTAFFQNWAAGSYADASITAIKCVITSIDYEDGTFVVDAYVKKLNWDTLDYYFYPVDFAYVAQY